MTNINIEARQQRHDKIWIKKQKLKRDKSKLSFMSKIFLLSFAFLIIDIINWQYIIYWKQEIFNEYSYENISNQTYILEEDWFVLKRELQTEKRNTEGQNKLIEHIVREWETLSSIASEYQINITTIIDANEGISPYRNLYEWQKLTILPVDWISIVLSSDKSVDEIAKKYKIEPDTIVKQNNIWTWSLALEKWTFLIIPWVTLNRYNRLSRQTWAPSSWANYKYNWKVNWMFIRPAEGTLTQWFHRYHYAVDIANGHKWPIFAAADWVVKKVKNSWWNWWYWIYVILDHWNWIETLYAHNEKNYVKEGDTVKQWQTIAWMWRTWRVRWRTWIHLHFEVTVNWRKANPLAYIWK